MQESPHALPVVQYLQHALTVGLTIGVAVRLIVGLAIGLSAVLVTFTVGDCVEVTARVSCDADF
jgi:hypothetical protein